MPVIASLAYAKINLGLEILEKRNDGFHNINTIFSRISLWDTVTISDGEQLESGSIQVHCEPDLGIAMKDNLAYKAADRLSTALGVNRSVRISIRKGIPSGAGLGGGSSDAATVLRLLPILWKVPTPHALIRETASSLGSDIPYFLKWGSAIGHGKGELLEYFTYRIPYWILLVLPGIHVSTPWAYAALDRRPGEKRSASSLRSLLSESPRNPGIFRASFVNDFELPVFERFPELADIKDVLYRGKALYASMSGSGSAIFAFFESRTLAELTAQRINQYKVHILRPDSWH